MPYVPANPPADMEAWREYVEQELLAIAREFQGLDSAALRELHVEPLRPREGMVVMADGGDWDPGSGKGFYGYKSGAWVFLG